MIRLARLTSDPLQAGFAGGDQERPGTGEQVAHDAAIGHQAHHVACQLDRLFRDVLLRQRQPRRKHARQVHVAIVHRPAARPYDEFGLLREPASTRPRTTWRFVPYGDAAQRQAGRLHHVRQRRELAPVDEANE
ncbi:hypothetical protein CPT_Musica_015 [Burkholderia phage Musica]|uniref:Uncharacterized protein n=1 Tax=Burkholderia phage Musica TaxID=2924903 RepID=A0AAE9K4N1_9CAUD|nr:hypothetical protein CPT_Musica_015 [Burkholderia phage Musica]